MNARRMLTREEVLGGLSNALKPLEYVHAMWEGGAPGFGRVDEWSDIDLYIVVDDDKVAEAFQTVEEALRSLSEISLKLDVGPIPQQGVFQAFYRLASASEHMIIDLAVIRLSAPDKFLEPITHGEAAFYFNKGGRVGQVPFDPDALRERVSSRIARLRSRMAMFGPFVVKEINRGNSIEAIDNYRTVVLDSLTELLRIRYRPEHHQFRTRYVHYELPRDVVRRLEALSFVAGVEDLKAKLVEAQKWFSDVSDEIESMGVDALVPKAR